MDNNSRLELSFYSNISTLNEAHRIYLVRHIETQKIYVKKILSVYNLSVYQRLKDCPIQGIPHIYCLHEENNELTVIEEYISGSTLEEILETSGALSEAATEKYLLELCDIVRELHTETTPIIHRDIKPSNIIITPHGHVFLIDLNAARPNIPKEEDTVLLGTKGYAAPEQYGFGSSDITADIYAIGMLINTMLNGRFLPQPISYSRFTPIIRRCTMLDPKERFSSVSELQSAIRAGRYPSVPTSYATPQRIFLPPGFRTGNVLHMIMATPVYLFLLWFCLTLDMSSLSVGALWFARIFILLISFSVIACVTNYLNIQNIMPLCRSAEKPKKLIGILTLTACLVTALFFLMTIGVMLFSTTV